MRLLPTLLALTVAASGLAFMPADAATGGGHLTAATAASDTGLTVDILPRQDGTFVAGSDLTVAVRLANDSDVEVPAGTATVYLARTPVDDRADLDAWLLGEDADPAEDAELTDYRGIQILQLTTPAVLPGASVVLPDAVVPAASLPFAAGSAGVYLLSASAAAGAATPAVSHSALTLRAATTAPTRLALAMPIALPPAERGVISADDLAAYTAPGGLLDRQLAEASAQPVTIGIDPRIIASIRLLGTDAPASAVAWLERLRTVPNDTFALTYADTDIAATSQAGSVVLTPTSFAIDAARFPVGSDAQGAGTATPSPTPTADPVLPTLDDLLSWNYTVSGIAWPRDDSVVTADLGVFSASGLPTTIVSSTNATAAPGSPASGTADGHRVARADDTLSRLLREAVAAPTLAEWQADVARLNAAVAGVSATTGTGAGPDTPITLATLGRDVPTVEFRLASTVAAVTGSGLATPASFSDAITQAPAEATIVDAPVAADRVAQLRGMFASEGAVAQFATVLEDPTPLTGERRLSLMALASQSWAADAAEWPAAVARYGKRSTDILSSVVVASTSLVQTSDRNPLPIVVTNALDYPVTVTVEVVALRPIVAIKEPSVDITIPANSQKRASIAAESIANGEVGLSISLYSPTRVLIAAPSLIAVTVSAGWETTATSVLGVIVVAVFIAGIIRTIRRRRRIARGEQVDDREPDVRDLNDSVAGR